MVFDCKEFTLALNNDSNNLDLYHLYSFSYQSIISKMTNIKVQFFSMAGLCEVVLEGKLSESEMTTIANQAILEIKRIESKYSRYDSKSLISKINSNSGIQDIPIDEETFQLLSFAKTLYDSSQGLFDLTSGVLREVWSFNHQKVPTTEELKPVLSLIDWTSLQFDKDKVFLKKTGMQIDFGGFGKEYAADRAASTLMSKGIQHGYINLSGDIFVVGPKSNGSPWCMGVQHPREKNTIFASIPIYHGALATSGDYERFFILNGQRYCHIMNPKTGFPVSEWQSISVLAPLTCVAGSAATIAMLLEKHAIEYLDETGFAYLAINCQGKVFQKR